MSRIPLHDEVAELDEFEPEESRYSELDLDDDGFEREFDDDADHEEGLSYEQERY